MVSVDLGNPSSPLLLLFGISLRFRLLPPFLKHPGLSTHSYRSNLLLGKEAGTAS